MLVNIYMYFFSLVLFISEVRCFPAGAAVDEVYLSQKEQKLLQMLQKKYHFNDAEMEATKELIEDEEEGVDPEQDKIVFKLQVEEIVRKISTMSEEEMTRIKTLFVKKMGQDRADDVFNKAEEIYQREEEAKKELEHSFKLNEGEEEAFEELVDDTEEGKDPEKEDVEFKLGLAELADQYMALTPEEEELFRDLVEEEFGSENATRIFHEIRMIHEEMENTENPFAETSIMFAEDKVNKVADDEENKKFWGMLDVDVSDDGSENNGEQASMDGVWYHFGTDDDRNGQGLNEFNPGDNGHSLSTKVSPGLAGSVRDHFGVKEGHNNQGLDKTNPGDNDNGLSTKVSPGLAGSVRNYFGANEDYNNHGAMANPEDAQGNLYENTDTDDRQQEDKKEDVASIWDYFESDKDGNNELEGGNDINTKNAQSNLYENTDKDGSQQEGKKEDVGRIWDGFETNEDHNNQGVNDVNTEVNIGTDEAHWQIKMFRGETITNMTEVEELMHEEGHDDDDDDDDDEDHDHIEIINVGIKTIGPSGGAEESLDNFNFFKSEDHEQENPVGSTTTTASSGLVQTTTPVEGEGNGNLNDTTAEANLPETTVTPSNDESIRNASTTESGVRMSTTPETNIDNGTVLVADISYNGENASNILPDSEKMTTITPLSDNDQSPEQSSNENTSNSVENIFTTVADAANVGNSTAQSNLNVSEVSLSEEFPSSLENITGTTETQGNGDIADASLREDMFHNNDGNVTATTTVVPELNNNATQYSGDISEASTFEEVKSSLLNITDTTAVIPEDSAADSSYNISETSLLEEPKSIVENITGNTTVALNSSKTATQGDGDISKASVNEESEGNIENITDTTANSSNSVTQSNGNSSYASLLEESPNYNETDNGEMTILKVSNSTTESSVDTSEESSVIQTNSSVETAIDGATNFITEGNIDNADELQLKETGSNQAGPSTTFANANSFNQSNIGETEDGIENDENNRITPSPVANTVDSTPKLSAASSGEISTNGTQDNLNITTTPVTMIDRTITSTAIMNAEDLVELPPDVEGVVDNTVTLATVLTRSVLTPNDNETNSIQTSANDTKNSEIPAEAVEVPVDGIGNISGAWNYSTEEDHGSEANVTNGVGDQSGEDEDIFADVDDDDDEYGDDDDDYDDVDDRRTTPIAITTQAANSQIDSNEDNEIDSGAGIVDDE